MMLPDQLQNFIQSKLGLGVAYAIHVVFAILILMSFYQASALFSSSPIRQLSAYQSPGPMQKLPDMSAWHLFGINGLVEHSTTQLPKTSLNLQLTGVFVTLPASLSHAVIMVPGGKETIYRVGDFLPGDAKVYEIFSDRVVIQRNDHAEILYLPTKQISFVSGLTNMSDG